MENNITRNSFFIGPIDDWLSQIPEEAVDYAIALLSLNPNEIIRQYKDDHGNVFYATTQKDIIWRDLVCVIYGWGRKSDTDNETSVSELIKYSKTLKAHLSKAYKALEMMEYSYLFDIGTNSKEHIVSKKIRQKSNSKFVSDAIILQDYQKSGVWEKYYPIDSDLPVLISKIKNICNYTDDVINDLNNTKKGRGLNNVTKRMHDNLLYQLCLLYKKYYGSLTMPYIDGLDTSIVKDPSNIISFLQIVLPHTSYKRELTKIAIHKKLSRMPDDAKFEIFKKDTEI